MVHPSVKTPPDYIAVTSPRNATSAEHPFEIVAMSHRINRRGAIASLLAASGATLAAHVARAERTFSNRAIRIVVPVAAGGGVDTFARLIASKITTQRDVQFIIENRTGGNSTIGGLDVRR